MNKPERFLVNENPQLIQQLADAIKKKFLREGTGHDWWHIGRVWRMSKYIAQREASSTQPIDMFIVEGASLLHDIADWKFFEGDETVGPKKAREILTTFKIDKETADHISQIILDMPFKGAGVSTRMETIEGRIVQDSDRLDAIGAIGIARVFAYTGYKNKPIYDPRIEPVAHKSFSEYKKSTTAINHFSEKLLLLKDRLNTKTAKRIAQSRHRFMKVFLKQFYKEWWQFKDRRKGRPSRSELF